LVRLTKVQKLANIYNNNNSCMLVFTQSQSQALTCKDHLAIYNLIIYYLIKRVNFKKKIYI